VHAHDKFIVYGDVLVDDKPANVMEWQEAYPNGLAVLWRMGHNAKHVWPVEVSNLDELRALLTARWGL
jgi:5'(3')-deoxyribonucleotidase